MSDERPTHLDLFSGIGGFALAAQWAGFRTIGFCEIDKYCQKVLAKNFGANQGWRCPADDFAKSVSRGEIGDNARIYGNIFDFYGRQFKGVDLITGGFPCQPFSVAGKRRGAADDRAIWPEMFRVINEARPAWVLGENVPGIIPMELDNVLSDLEGIGYSTRAFVIPACAVNARHRRDRLWIIGRLVPDTDRERGCSGNSEREDAEDVGEQPEHSRIHADTERNGSSSSQPGPGTERTKERQNKLQQSSGSSSVRNSSEQGLQNWRSESVAEHRGTLAESQRPDSNGECRWIPEPNVGRVAHGIPNRVDRLKGLGNAIVPQVAFEILKEIRQLL